MTTLSGRTLTSTPAHVLTLAADGTKQVTPIGDLAQAVAAQQAVSPAPAGGASGANPTATAKDTAVNGTATTFLRSDGAPAVQKASASLFGIVKVDGSSITATGGVISAAGGSATGLFNQVLSATPTSASTGLSTWANQGGSTTVADGATGMVLHDVSNGNAENSRLRYKTAPSRPYTIKALISVSSDLAANHHAVVMFGWYNGTKILGIGIHASNGSVNTLTAPVEKTNVTTDGGSSDLAVGIQDRLWVAINDDGSSLHLAYSADGANYIRVYDQTYAGSFLGAAPTDVFFGINPYGSAMYGTLLSYTESASNLP